MDLKNLETTSTYAIESAINKYWKLVPNDYKLPDKDNQGLFIEPFYDSTLTFENRAQYKITKVGLQERKGPWLVLSWNTEAGVQKSDINNRRFDTSFIFNHGQYDKYKFTWGKIPLNIAIYSNSLTCIMEMQENILLRVRNKDCIESTKPHSILGNFPIQLETQTSSLQKLDVKEKGSICYLYLNIEVTYPIIGYGSETWPIDTIISDIKKSDTNLLISKDIITDL